METDAETVILVAASAYAVVLVLLSLYMLSRPRGGVRGGPPRGIPKPPPPPWRGEG